MPKQLIKQGFTLIEVVVAVGVFGVLSIILSLLLVGTLRGSKKAAASILVRSEGTYAMESMTSQLRFAKAITDCSGSQIVATTQTGVSLTFTCTQSGSDTYLASNSARLTSTNVSVVSCASVFTCTADLRTANVSFSLQKAGSDLPIESAALINFNQEVGLRNN